MVIEDLVRLLADGDPDDVMAGLTRLTDRERKQLGPKARAWLTRGTTERIPVHRRELAVLATADGPRQALLVATYGFGPDADHVEDAVTLLVARGPSWLPDFVELLLGDEGTSSWLLAHGLVRSGAVPAPDHPEYFRGTVRGVPDYFSRDRVPLADRIARDPGLGGDHLIGMLSTEGTGRRLAYHDSFQETTYAHLPDHVPSAEATWRQALVTLAQQERLDRGRLLDAVLAAPSRDWSAADLGWYVGMHDALEPTLDEVVDRQQTYARWLTVEHGPSVKTAQRELLRLFGDPRFQPDLLLDASRATLARTDKASVVAQLRLLEKLAKAHPDVAMAETVRTALDHPRADVRALAAKLLGKLGADLPERTATVEFAPPEPEPRAPSPVVVPVADADELADVLLGLLEEVDPMELERAVDGLLRFATEAPAAAEVLLTRAQPDEYYSDDPRTAAATLARAWLLPRQRLRDGDWPILLGHASFPARAAAPDTMVGALGRRLAGVAHAVRHGTHASVALPLRADGALDADTLSARLAAVRRGQEPPETELAVALLRVPREQRAHVCIPSGMRGARSVARLLDTRPVSWERQVVTLRRHSWQPERQVPVFLDRGSTVGSALDGFLPRPAPDRTLGEELWYGEYEPRFEQTLAACALVLSQEPDALAAHAHPYLHRDLHKDRATSTPVLDAIARSRVPNGAPSSSALVLGLAAKDARARTAAQDALLDLARHGLLDGARLGEHAAAHLADGIVVGQRLSNGLAEVVRAGDAAALPVLDALQSLAAVLPGRRDAGAFLELAADLVERTGRELAVPDAFRELAEGRSSSLLARAVRRLVRPDPGLLREADR